MAHRRWVPSQDYNLCSYTCALLRHTIQQQFIINALTHSHTHTQTHNTNTTQTHSHTHTYTIAHSSRANKKHSTRSLTHSLTPSFPPFIFLLKSTYLFTSHTHSHAHNTAATVVDNLTYHVQYLYEKNPK